MEGKEQDEVDRLIAKAQHFEWLGQEARRYAAELQLKICLKANPQFTSVKRATVSMTDAARSYLLGSACPK